MPHEQSEKSGTFIVSLDFELFWGMHDVTTLEAYGERIQGVHTAVPRLLELFEQYEIHASWAVVGMLAARSRKELEQLLPEVRPQYTRGQFSSYRHLAAGRVGEGEADDPFHFAPSLVEKIAATPHQEIACHTFSHYYCLEEGADTESFRADLLAWKQALGERAQLDSIVFPRNQVSDAHLAVCAELGIRAYRGTQWHPWYTSVDTKGQYRPHLRLLRLADSFVNLSGHHTYPLESAHEEALMNLRASRFLRPYSKRLSFLEPLKVARVKAGITHAARTGEVFHLWWHPHNFGADVEENCASLELILQHAHALVEEGYLRSATMQEVSEL